MVGVGRAAVGHDLQGLVIGAIGSWPIHRVVSWHAPTTQNAIGVGRTIGAIGHGKELVYTPHQRILSFGT